MRRFVTLLIGAILVASAVSVTPTQAQSGRQVWAWYFGWFTYDTWSDGRLRDIPAQPYDSLDGGVQGRQIQEAQSAGIDAFIMSWFGSKNNNLTQQVFTSMLNQAGGRGFKMGAAVDLVDPGYFTSEQEVISEMSYLINDLANHGAYLRYNGKPVIYIYNQGRYSLSQWQNIRAAVDPNHNTIWLSEGTTTQYIPTFEGLYLFNSAWSSSPASTARQFKNATTNAGGTFFAPTAHPGWNEDALAAGRSNPTAAKERDNGTFLRNSFNGAAQGGTDVILIVSWNEYFENSHIEPSQAFGTQALDILRELIPAWKVNQPAATASTSTEGASASVAPAGAAAGQPSGLTFNLGYNAKFRSAPSTSGTQLAQIPFGTVLEVVGRSSDNAWLQVNYNGGSGWVSLSLGTLSGDLNGLPING
ncbi:MAG: endo-1,3-alpha-glucanase family glycosylhydrolase [Phototrophicaceae bacterium]